MTKKRGYKSPSQCPTYPNACAPAFISDNYCHAYIRPGQGIVDRWAAERRRSVPEAWEKWMATVAEFPPEWDHFCQPHNGEHRRGPVRKNLGPGTHCRRCGHDDWVNHYNTQWRCRECSRRYAANRYQQEKRQWK